MRFSASWINLFGLGIMVILFVPNIVYMLRNKGLQNKCCSLPMNVLEQIGRYGCLFLMVFNIGIAEFGFASDIGFLVYLLGNGFCLAAYLAVWLRYFKKPGLSCALALAILPTLIFLLSGITLRHWLLVGSAVLFGVGHIYVTYVNARGGE